jgi:hypothetical protein
MSTAKKLSAKAVAAIIARRKAQATTGTARRTRSQTRTVNVKPAVFSGTISDITEVNGRAGKFVRAQFVMRAGDDFNSVTALISEKTAAGLGDALTEGFIKLYGALQGDTLRVLGLGRNRQFRLPEAPALKEGPAAEYGYQYGAYFAN